jgi:hypothetical protein
MSDQFGKVQNELWEALVALARAVPLGSALKDAHSRLKDAHSSLRESGHGETLLASIASKIMLEPGRVGPGPGSGQVPVTAEVAESVERMREFIVQPSFEQVLSRLPGELTERIGSAEVEDLVRRLVARETARIAAGSTAPHGEG